jgi:RND family efflux transporter MFP subunit
VFTIVDLAKMELDAPAPTSEIPSVKVGQTARFRVDGFGDREFTGTVWRINPVAEQGSRSIMVYFTVPNVDGALKGGMFAQGDLALDAGLPVPAVPFAAVRSESGVDYVWVVQDGIVQRRSVSFGLKSPADGLIEVHAGLKAGEQVVVAQIENLKDGTHVKLVSDPAPAPATSGSAAAQ